MFYLFSAIVLLVPVLFGGYMLFTPMERLIAGVAWMRLPMPKEGSGAYSALRLFWRSLGVIAWVFAAFVLYMLFIRKP
jgi:hypothetical protein